MPEQERLRIEYVPLSKAVEWDWEENPKEHDIGALAEAIWKYGFLDPPKYDAALDRFVYGNGRTQAVAWGKEQGRKPPAAVITEPESGEWLIPVKFGCDLESAAVAKALAVDHNNLGYMGAEGAMPWDLARMWDEPSYFALLAELAEDDALPISVSGDDLDALLADAPETQEPSKPKQSGDDGDAWIVCPECGHKWQGWDAQKHDL